MLKVLGCVVHEHDLRLVAMSAVICVLGCLTTTSLMAKASEAGSRHPRRWLACAAALFGCSVWALHFVAMLAFMPGLDLAYDLLLTGASIVVVSVGGYAALLAWRVLPRPRSIVVGGTLLGLAMSGMHYVGVAAMSFSGFTFYDPGYVAASIASGVVFSIVAMTRASDLGTTARRLEVGGWLALAITGMHFVGMTAITVAPGPAQSNGGTVLATTTLAIAVGSVSVAILVAAIAAMTVERHMSRSARDHLDRMRHMANLATEVLFVHRDGIVLELNTAGERLFKTRADAVVGRPVLDLFSEDSVPALIRRERCVPLERNPEEMEVMTADGTRVPVELSCQPIEYLGKPATVIQLRNLSDRKRTEARFEHLARHDALTKLPNRFNLQERLELALRDAARRDGGIAVVYVDLDRFKPVNDLHGHAAGDALLVLVAKRLLAELGPSDTLARIGGDEFVMVLTEGADPDRTSTIAARAIEALRRPFQVERHRVEIGASIGIALYPDDGEDPDALMRAADAAMYRAKEEGRGALRFYEASMGARLQDRLQLEHELSGAVERGEMALHYQPIVNGVTGEVETFEALIRWFHPTRGTVPPFDFIPLAEETGLIDQIGQWVIDAACREAAGWSRPARVSINVSPMQFRQTDVCAVLADALATNALDPARVVVEVTEGILIDDPAKAVVTLNRLRAMGVRVALDDFGTGYSSLSYLRLFKFDKFKIDKSFVRELAESEDALTIVRTIVNLGHNLGLQVTAEGVETQAQLDVLRSLRCDQIQGYLVARPAPIDAFTDLDRLRTKALFGRDRPRLSA